MSDTVIQVRIDARLKKHAEDVLLSMGMKIPEAVRIFLQQTINDQTLPFKPSARKKANKETLRSFKEAENGKYTDCTLAEFKKSLKL